MSDQNAAVLELLRAHPEGVTQGLALREVGTTRLAARIWELIHVHGFTITQRMVVVPTRNGGRTRVASYVLDEGPAQRELFGMLP